MASSQYEASVYIRTGAHRERITHIHAKLKVEACSSHRETQIKGRKITLLCELKQ